MQLYEYVIVRYVPRVEREEFFNVGVLMMCKRKRWIRFAAHIDGDKFASFNPPHSIDEVGQSLLALKSIAMGSADGTLHDMEVEERFRWLGAVKSACIQCSRPHPGLTDDLDATFDRIFQQQVL